MSADEQATPHPRLRSLAHRVRLRDNPAARAAWVALVITPHARLVCLGCLHQDYAEKVNRLVAEDREDLIPEAVAAYVDEALHAITAGKAA